MKNNFKIFWLIFSLLFLSVNTIQAASITDKLRGKILIQVQSHGEAWYVNPKNNLRYYLGRPEDALKLFQQLGVGITNADLFRITYDKVFTQKNLGRIFLQVQAHGEAWYVNPGDGQGYLLGNPMKALQIMKLLGMGISNADLQLIGIGYLSDSPKLTLLSTSTENNLIVGRYSLLTMEKDMFQLVNAERQKANLPALIWNDELAKVAREHSQNLAHENLGLTGLSLSCDFPFIHHEGLDFGLFQQNRLNNRGIYYFSQSGENIALVPVARRYVSLNSSENNLSQKLDTCPDRQSALNMAIKQKTENQALSDQERMDLVKSEINKRLGELKKEISVNVEKTEWSSQDLAETSTITGWMNSPGHRANILKDAYDEAGMGAAYVNGYFIATQVFIKRAECGYKGGTCCEKAGYYPYCYLPYNCQNSICQ